MSTEQNKAIDRRVYEEVWNGGSLAVIDELVAANYVDHDPQPTGALEGLAGLKQSVTMYRSAFPDVHFTVEDQIAEGDLLVTRWTARGTHQGPLMGIPPTGKQAMVTGISITRVASGKVVERIKGNRSRRIPAVDTRWMSGKRLDVFMSLAYFAIGFSPITALAIAIIGFLPLSVTALIMVVPSVVLGIGLAFMFPYYGKLAIKGLFIGLIAVLLYDCMRVPFILAGIWGDFIPKISIWLLNTSQPNWMVGYLWRYLGDGGFMGMAFTVAYCTLKPRVGGRTAALGFGIAIWLCLLATLILAPHGEAMLFKLTLTTLSLSFLGHLIYGASIGMLLSSVCREEVAGTEPWKQQTIPLLQDVVEEPIWEKKTLTLIGRLELPGKAFNLLFPLWVITRSMNW